MHSPLLQKQANPSQALDSMDAYRQLLTPHLGGLARACFTDNHNHLVFSDDLQQLITAVINRQEAALLLQSPALGPVTDSLQAHMPCIQDPKQ